jgi:hypothetical protein
MLGEIERKLTAILGDGLAARTHLQVVEGGAAPPDAGKEVVQVFVADLTPAGFFDRDQFTISATPPATPAPVRRILPVQLSARVAFTIRAQDGTAASITTARGLLLDDVSLAAHLLADPTVSDGSAFLTNAPDPGFEMRSFALDSGTVPSDGASDLLTAELLYRGEAAIWPPGAPGAQGKIVAVDPISVALPIQTMVDVPSVRAGTGTRVRVRGVQGSRLLNPATGERTPARLSVTVVSDLPMGQRGSITSGDPGAETGFRIVTLGEPETVLDYTAPPGDLGTTRVEFVAIHLATPSGQAGTFLGSAAVPLVPKVGP